MPQHHMHIPDNPRILQHATRAGELVQVLFYAILENTWAYDLSSIRIVRNELGQLARVEVTDGLGVKNGPGRQSTCERYADGWLIRFPDKGIDPVDRDAMRALLADHNSTWALVCMHVAVQVLFEHLVVDVDEDIKELVHNPGKHVRSIVKYKNHSGSHSKRNDRLYPDMDAKGRIKAVYDITLRDGTRIVLDPASAEWRLQDLSMPNQPVLQWSEYWQLWGGTLKYRVPFRTHTKRHAEKMNACQIVTHHSLTMEQMFYFNTFTMRLKKKCPGGLSWAFDMDIESFTDFKARILGQALDYIQRRPKELDGEASSPSPISNSPTQYSHTHNSDTHNSDTHNSDTHNSDDIILEAFELPRSLLFDIGTIAAFDWTQLRRVIQSSNKVITYKEKKRARMLLSYRCVYKVPGDWRLVFLKHTLPDLRIPGDCVSENPFWH